MRKTSKFISLVTVLAMVLALFCVPALAADEDTATVYTFDTVTVNEDGTVDGVEGEHLTMVVDGVETEMEPGTYEGDITITATPTFTLTTDVSTASDEADASASGESSGEINMSASGEASGETDASASGETEGSEESTGITRSPLGDEVVDTSGLDDYRTAIYVDGNGLSETYSVLAALQTGEADDEGASDITITATSDTLPVS
ncbi:MAG: hypothetical protein LUG57_00520 [Oscillospiraceae bacterium]|nr:hypothetical protein [Oscillospiraceae bacterium]